MAELLKVGRQEKEEKMTEHVKPAEEVAQGLEEHHNKAVKSFTAMNMSSGKQ